MNNNWNRNLASSKSCCFYHFIHSCICSFTQQKVLIPYCTPAILDSRGTNGREQGRQCSHFQGADSKRGGRTSTEQQANTPSGRALSEAVRRGAREEGPPRWSCTCSYWLGQSAVLRPRKDRKEMPQALSSALYLLPMPPIG